MAGKKKGGEKGGAAVAEAAGKAKAPAAGGFDFDQQNPDGDGGPGPAVSEDGSVSQGGAPAAGEPAGEPADKIEIEAMEEFTVFKVDPRKLRLNSQARTEEEVNEMAASIVANGIQNPVVITTDNMVSQGNCRTLAFIKLKRYEMPARFALHPQTQEPMSSDEIEVTFAGMAENLSRNDPSQAVIAKMCEDFIKAGVVQSVKELAAKTGIPFVRLDRASKIYTNGTRKLQAAVESHSISPTSAEKLVRRAANHQELDALTDGLLKAADGKGVTKADVDSAKPAFNRRSGRHASQSKTKRGRPVSVIALSPESLDADESGVSAELKRTGENQFVFTVTVPIVCDDLDSFAKFNLAQEAQKVLTKVKITEVRKELESVRKRLTA